MSSFLPQLLMETVRSDELAEGLANISERASIMLMFLHC